MEFIAAIVLLVAFYFWREYVRQRKLESEERSREVVRLALEAAKVLDRLVMLKTTGAKANHCGKALALLKRAEQYPECRRLLENFDELKQRLLCVQKVLPVVDKVERSYRHRFKGKDKLELNALQDALYEIRTAKVTDADFAVAQVYPEGTTQLLSVGELERRCEELGWTPN